MCKLRRIIWETVGAATYRQAEFDGVDRLVERPGELMLPQSLHHHILHVLQLVGLPDGHKHTATRTQGDATVNLLTTQVPAVTSCL